MTIACLKKLVNPQVKLEPPDVGCYEFKENPGNLAIAGAGN
jgi:hypothetical protein